MADGQFFIVGLGRIGLSLIRNLSRDIGLVCIDANAEALTLAKQARGEDLQTILGDATSRLVLEEAGIGRDDTVIVATASEKVNIEVARILKEHFEIRRTIAVGITQKGMETLEDLGVEVESIFAGVATGLRNRLEQKIKAVQGIGLGKNEILEVEVHHNSRFANKPLSSLNPKSWRIGIVYRDGNILVPRGDTVLRAKDRVIIMGDPKVLKTVTDLLTFRFTHFPLEYGDTLTAFFTGAEDESYLREIAYLLEVFPLEKAVFLLPHKDTALEEQLRDFGARTSLRECSIVTEVAGRPLEAFQSLVRQMGRRTSLAILPGSLAEQNFFSFLGRHYRKEMLLDLSELLGCPIVLARGTFPYRKVAVPCLSEDGLQHAMETTLEMSASTRYQIEAFFVTLSRYISSEEEMRAYTDMKRIIADMGLIYKTYIPTRELKGNPVHAVTRELRECNLLVTELGGWRRGSPLAAWLRPDVGWETTWRAPTSCLLIPAMELIV
ncbi:MAG: TrkA family potassium uptake protein [Desulfuromonadales bacterium]